MVVDQFHTPSALARRCCAVSLQAEVSPANRAVIGFLASKACLSRPSRLPALEMYAGSYGLGARGCPSS